MLKLLGAVCILLSTSAIGFRKAHSFAERPRQIRRIRGSLSLLQTEIVYGSRRLDRICEHIAARETGSVGSLYARCGEYLKTWDGVSTFECWKRAVEETWPLMSLKEPEREILIDFGKTLGVSNREDQLTHLARVRTNLEVEENQARDEQLRYEKMCRSLGILGGALIVILIY